MVKLGINKISRVQQGLGRLLRPERERESRAGNGGA